MTCSFLAPLVLCSSLATSIAAAAPNKDPPEHAPNFVVILCDNLGYGDVGCFGSTVHRTPNVDRMADEGMRLTSFYSTSGVCTPSRASLMTGRPVVASPRAFWDDESWFLNGFQAL